MAVVLCHTDEESGKADLRRREVKSEPQGLPRLGTVPSRHLAIFLTLGSTIYS